MLTSERRTGETVAPQQSRLARAGAVPVATASAAAKPMAAPETRTDPLTGRLARVVTARTLQRLPADRATDLPTRAGAERLGHITPEAEFGKIRDLRVKHHRDASFVVGCLEFSHLSGSPDSDVTKDKQAHKVRIDRQNPLDDGQNLQIQTNGTSISIATVLIDNRVLDNAKGGHQQHVVRVVRRAFLHSLADGMQWEVYDAPVTEKAPAKKGAYKKKGGSGGKGAKGRRGEHGSVGGSGRGIKA